MNLNSVNVNTTNENNDLFINNALKLYEFMIGNLKYTNIDKYSMLFEPINLCKLIESCNGWKTLYGNDGSSYGGEHVTNGLLLGLLPNIYLEIQKEKVLVSFFDLLDKFFSLDYNLRNSSHLITHNVSMEINDFINIYLGLGGLSTENIEFIKNYKLEYNKISNLLSSYKTEVNKLNKHYSLSKIDDNFKLGLCSIENRKNSPTNKLYDNRNDYQPFSTNDILDSLIYKVKGFFITDIINDDGFIKFKTNMPEDDVNHIITYNEMKDIANELLTEYNEEVVSKMKELNKTVEFLKDYNVDNINSFIDMLRDLKSKDIEL